MLINSSHPYTYKIKTLIKFLKLYYLSANMYDNPGCTPMRYETPKRRALRVE